MSGALRICAGQLNQWVGDIDGNVERMLAAARHARDEHGARLIVFPELSLIGYPPDDLLLRRGMPPAVAAGVERLTRELRGIVAVVGLPEFAEGRIYNAAWAIGDGRVLARCRKRCLPNYGVFDEQRHFSSGNAPCVFTLDGVRIGVTICEDMWFPEPTAQVAAAGAELIVNLNASPWEIGKRQRRRGVLTERIRESGLPVLYVNAVGGQDELVFDGRSLAMNADGQSAFEAPAFAEAVGVVDWDGSRFHGDRAPEPSCPEEEIWSALTTAIRDYTDRNSFPGALVGLSGGIDSAVVATLACDALGADRVWTVAMPSRYTSAMSREDAAEQARRLGCRHDEIPIEPVFGAFMQVLAPLFGDRPADQTEENLQSRTRGTLLMALSNKFGHLLLATGNKSEMAVGYATLYGDMCGGFAPIKDVYKTTVYALARWRNARGEVIPPRVLERPPSAELRADQKDSDSLPDYAVLDPLLVDYVERQLSIEQIKAKGVDEALVRRVASLVRRAEYKRRQAPPGPKVTPRAFGRDRRYPITAVYGDL